MSVPDYDLLPVNAVHQALLLLRDILETQNDNFPDQKETYVKVIKIFYIVFFVTILKVYLVIYAYT